MTARDRGSALWSTLKFGRLELTSLIRLRRLGHQLPPNDFLWAIGVSPLRFENWRMK